MGSLPLYKGGDGVMETFKFLCYVGRIWFKRDIHLGVMIRIKKSISKLLFNPFQIRVVRHIYENQFLCV